MKSKWVLYIITFLVTISLVFVIYKNESTANQKGLEESRQEVITLLQEQLEQFNPALASFVDEDYKTVITSKISPEGICKFERLLAKDKEAFGTYLIKYDLVNMEVLSQELIITNGEYSDEWDSFKGNF